MVTRTLGRAALLAVLSITLLAYTSAAQTLGGRVIDKRTRLPLQRVSVVVLADSERTVATTRSDTTGLFYADLPAPGRYRIRFSLDSAHVFDSEVVAIPDSSFVQREFVVALLPIEHVYFEFQVEKQVSTRRGSPHPRYPLDMKTDNIEGEVLAQFVVDTNGRVRPGSFKVLRATHPSFVEAVRRVLPDMLFSPAEIGGRRVPQMVQQPFTFALSY